MPDFTWCRMKRPRIPGDAPFNPLDKKNLGVSVTEAMLARPVSGLPPRVFSGAGIYAIYYVGDFESYKEVAKRNRHDKFSWPIVCREGNPGWGEKRRCRFRRRSWASFVSSAMRAFRVNRTSGKSQDRRFSLSFSGSR
jgi:hypothetical protein